MSEQPEITRDDQDTDELRDAIIQNMTEHQYLGAGAGAGKTTVLVDHYFYLLEQGCRPAELVAVTFTEKAAAEMKGRLREKCRERARKARQSNKEADREKWEGLLHELENAPISTIHGLCARLLREHALVAGLDPDFTVLDEVDAQILLDEVVRQTLLSRLGSNITASELVVALRYNEAVDAITKLVQDRVKLAGVLEDKRYENPATLKAHWLERLTPDRQRLLKEVIEHPEWEPHLRLIDEHQGPADDALTGLQIELRQIIRDCDMRHWSSEDLNSENMGQMIDDLQRLNAVRAPGRWGNREQWQASGCDKQAMATAQECFTQEQGAISLLIQELLPLKTNPDLDESCARTTCALVAEVKAALKAYEKIKAQRSALDFEDLMEHLERLWVKEEGLLADISGALKHVMVDEFQDTNSLQKQILWPLVTGRPYNPAQPDRLPPGGPYLFVVGDAKQSIYRFRNADVTVVNRTRAEMLTKVARNDELTRNFRSTAGLIDVYNQLFAHEAVMGTEVSEDFMASYAPMFPVRGNPPTGQAPLEVHLLTESSAGGGGYDDGGEGETGLAALRVREATWLAQRLVALLNDPAGQYCQVQESQKSKEEGEQWRPARPGDVALLFRSMRDVAIYERALRDAGLPYYLVVGQGFFGAQEVQDLVQALRVVENGLDDIALVGALRSPLFGLSDETLYWLGQLGPGPWWWRLLTAAQGPEDEPRQALVAQINVDQQQRLQRAAAVLNDLRRQKNRLSLSALVQTLIDRTGFTAVLAAQFGGRQMVSNARKLVELAGEFEVERQTQGQSGLRDFIEHLKRMTAEEVREGQAPVEEEAGNSIKLITYHSAKGLQWPIVIVPDLCRQPGGGGFGPPYRFHMDEGLVVSTTYLEKPGSDSSNSYWPPLGQLIKNRNEAEEEAENRRLFYVAATRAKDLLVLSGVTQLSKQGKLDANARRSPLGWINEALPGALWAAERNEAADSCWRWNGTTLETAGELCNTAGADFRHPEGKIPEAQPDFASLAQRVAPIAAAANGQRRFTATELSLYDHCPYQYYLERRCGLPGAEISLGAEAEADRLSPLEFGTVVHRVLQLVGTGGQAELNRLVPEGAKVLRLDPLLDRRAAHQAGEIRRRVQTFLAHDMYRELFTPTSKLRSEVGLAVLVEVPGTAVPVEGDGQTVPAESDGQTVPVKGDGVAIPAEGNGEVTLVEVDGGTVLVEGKIDALIEGPEGQWHLIDYKTAACNEQYHGQYVVQLGLYCYAVQQASGRLPATAALVYLSENQADVRYLDVGAATTQALDAARRAVSGIWCGKTPQRDDCGYCVARWICQREKAVADEIVQNE